MKVIEHEEKIKEGNEAPTPFISENINKKEIKLVSKENQPFTITMTLERDYIIIQAKKNFDLKNKQYKKLLLLKDFYNSNNYFYQFKTIEQLFRQFLMGLKIKEYEISSGSKNVMIIISKEIKKKKVQVVLILKPEEINIDDIVSNLCNEIDYLKKENDELKKIISIHKKDIEELKKAITELKNSNGNIMKGNQKQKKINEKLGNGILANNYVEKKEIDNKEEKHLKKYNKKEIKNILVEYFTSQNNELKSFPDIQSKIIKNEELGLIEEGIRRNFNRKIVKYKLLFRATRDGFEAKDFHSKCDNKSFTVTFVKTKNGRRFGGFTDAEWSWSADKTGSKGFIFSLDNKEIYYNKDSNYNIQYSDKNGPIFGNYDFLISNNCDKNNKSYDCSNDSYETYGKDYALAGTFHFYVDNYEVYKLVLE